MKDRIDLLYETCCPVVTTPSAPIIVPAEQNAEIAGEVAEKAIEDIKPESQSTDTTSTTGAEGAEGVANESTEGTVNE